MVKINEKRGEITTQQIVMLIILILSFSVILFLIFRLDLGQITNEEICRNSVILKGKSTFKTGNLDCRTSYVCISGGGDCEGINPTKTIEVKGDSAEIEKQVMKALAEEMASCWFIFGEGKVDYVSGGAFENVACSICSITSFSEEIGEIESITYEKFYEYLKTAPKSNSQTYLQYLYRTNNLGDFREGFNPQNYLENSLESGKTYFILTGLIKEGYVRNYLLSVNKWKFWNTEFTPQPVIILENTPENYEAVGCDSFITKA